MVLHQARAEQQRLAQEAQRTAHGGLLDRGAAGVAHAIRHPPRVVLRLLDLLEEESPEQTPRGAALVAETRTDFRTPLARLQDLGSAVQEWAQAQE